MCCVFLCRISVISIGLIRDAGRTVTFVLLWKTLQFWWTTPYANSVCNMYVWTQARDIMSAAVIRVWFCRGFSLLIVYLWLINRLFCLCDCVVSCVTTHSPVSVSTTAGQRRHQNASSGHAASLHQLARLRRSLLTHRHAEVPEEGEAGEPVVRRAHRGALQVGCVSCDCCTLDRLCSTVTRISGENTSCGERHVWCEVWSFKCEVWHVVVNEIFMQRCIWPLLCLVLYCIMINSKLQFKTIFFFKYIKLTPFQDLTLSFY